MSKYIQLGVDAVTRPPRDVYEVEQLPNSIFVPGYGSVNRNIVGFKNSRGIDIVGSYFAAREEIAERSCVIYLHGNASSQLEGMFLVPFFIPAGVSVLVFDFTGCGRSGGERISLGYIEKDDVACAIDYVRKTYNVGRVALWGRSMGAACTFFTLAEDPTIACAIADSSFSSLRKLVDELASMYKIPGLVASAAASIIGSKIKKIAGFDINDVNPIQAAEMCFTPIMIIHGEDDSFINCEHSKQLFMAYQGEEKQLIFVPGDHNSERPAQATVDAIMFIAQALDAPVVIDDIRDVMTSGRHHFAGIEEMMSRMESEAAAMNAAAHE